MDIIMGNYRKNAFMYLLIIMLQLGRLVVLENNGYCCCYS